MNKPGQYYPQSGSSTSLPAKHHTPGRNELTLWDAFAYADSKRITGVNFCRIQAIGGLAMNKRNIFRALGFSVILWGVGVVAVNNQSVASCTPESGFSGLVKKALFAPAGSCAVQANPRLCAAVGAACVVIRSLSPGSGTPGKCKQSVGGCVCRPND